MTDAAPHPGVRAGGGPAGRHDRGERFGARGGIAGLLVLSLFILATLALDALPGRWAGSLPAGWGPLFAAPLGTPGAREQASLRGLLDAAAAIAAWRVWLRAGLSPLGWWLVAQLLAVAWALALLVLHAPALALGLAVALWLALLATLRGFRQIDAVASGLLMPYLAWVTYAAGLNARFVWFA